MVNQKITKQQQINNIQIFEYTLCNEFLEVRFLNLGGVITKIALKHDDFKENLVLAYDKLESYFHNKCYLNALIGRTSNRIKDGQFPLNNEIVQVDLNDGPNQLHGGQENLTQRLFEVVPVTDGFTLTTTLPHQDDGFPGNVRVKVSYTLAANQLSISYEGTTDRDTIVNLTHHAYFNLSGNLKTHIYDHLLQIKANTVAEVDKYSSFTTKELPVAHTLFDFNHFRPINPKGMEVLPLFERTSGYDHLYLLNEKNEAVIFKDPNSGRTLKITTTAPSLQFYAGNYLTPDLLFERGRSGEIHLGACFETHLIPYDYKSQTIKPGEKYQQTTLFEFTLE